MEIRSFGNNAAPRIDAGGRAIEGYAIVFGQESEVMYDRQRKRRFTEVIQPGAVTEELLKRSDVKALLEHNAQRLLARSFNGVGTLTLSIDTYGVKYRFEAPNTALGDELLENLRRGEVDESSFAFSVESDTWEKRSDGIWKRTIHKFGQIYDVSPVYNAAYSKTSVYMRGKELAENELKEQEQRKLDEYYDKINKSC